MGGRVRASWIKAQVGTGGRVTQPHRAREAAGTHTSLCTGRLPLSWTHDARACHEPSRSCRSQHSRCPTGPPASPTPAGSTRLRRHHAIPEHGFDNRLAGGQPANAGSDLVGRSQCGSAASRRREIPGRFSQLCWRDLYAKVCFTDLLPGHHHGPRTVGPPCRRGPAGRGASADLAQRDTQSTTPRAAADYPQTRSCAGTATSSAAAGPPGPHAAGPAGRWPGARRRLPGPARGLHTARPTLARQDPEHLRQSCHWPQSRPRLRMGQVHKRRSAPARCTTHPQAAGPRRGIGPPHGRREFS
jgi:hypothetical protein